MFFQRGLGLGVPDLALLVREVLPGETDDLGQGAMVGLDLGGDVLVLDEGRAEEDEGVARARDVARVARGGGRGGVSVSDSDASTQPPVSYHPYSNSKAKARPATTGQTGAGGR